VVGAPERPGPHRRKHRWKRIEQDQREAKHREAVALFRYGLIADLTMSGRRGLYKKLPREGGPTRDPGSTGAGWRPNFGVAALPTVAGFQHVAKPRSQRPDARIPREVADLLLETKDQNRR